MNSSTLSWFLFPFSIIGFLMAGEKNRWGWALCIFTQLLWLAFAWQAKLWGIMPGSASYLLVYVKNLFGWEWKWLTRLQRQKVKEKV